MLSITLQSPEERIGLFMKSASKNKKVIIFLLCFLFLALFLFAMFSFRKTSAKREDFKRIRTEEYDAALLSMFPVDTYQPEDYAYWRSLTLFKASYLMPDLKTTKQYLERMEAAGNVLSTVYLGIYPQKATHAALVDLFRSFPDTLFEVTLAYPSASYWCQLSEKEYEKVLKDYETFLSLIPAEQNCHFYLPAMEEWLVANPANYETDFLLSEDAALNLMLHSDSSNSSCLVLPDSSLDSFAALQKLTQQLRSAAAPQDLSDYAVVFFGDSVIGNYTDSFSIPGVVAGLTNATVYNLGYGGNSAAMITEDAVALPSIADAFCRQDASILPTDTQVYAGFCDYLQNPPAETQKLCFVIQYGLNDYFSGYPVDGKTPYDTSSYSGAIRSAVATLREAFPEAEILLSTPNFINYYQQGTDPHGEGGWVLEDYVNAVIQLSKELSVTLADTYHEAGIQQQNQGRYLADQVHPNEAGRYLIGQYLIDFLK